MYNSSRKNTETLVPTSEIKECEKLNFEVSINGNILNSIIHGYNIQRKTT